MARNQFIKITPPVKAKAELIVPEHMKEGALQCLTDIRNLFGSKGDHWTKGDYHTEYHEGDYHPTTGEILQGSFDQYCLVGGIREIDGKYEAIARSAIALAVLEYADRLDDQLDEIDTSNLKQAAEALGDDGAIIDFNDDKHIDFEDIKNVLKLAKKKIKTAKSE